jgi:hypothetical protein
MKITLHIERLILDGLPITSHDAPLVRAAVEAELTRLFAERRIDPSPRASTMVPHGRAGSINLTHDLPPARLGQEIAGAVYKSIGSADVSARGVKSISQFSGAIR